MLTLNQVIKSLNDIADNHQQINHFFFGEEWDFATSGVVNTPAMITVLQPSTVGVNTFTYDFKIYIGDIVKKGLENKKDVLSDSIQIALDIIAELQSPTFTGVVDQNIVLNDFEDSFDCELYGVWFDLKIKFLNPFDRCKIPTVGSSFASGNPNCAPVTVYDQNGNLLTTVLSGGTITLGSGQFIATDDGLNITIE